MPLARPRCLTLLALALVVVPVAHAQSHAHAAPSVEPCLRALPALARAAADLPALVAAVHAQAQCPVATTPSSSRPVLRLEFATPLDARRVATLLAIAHPYAVSGDVHQETWSLVARTGSVPDPSNARLATEQPVFGHWTLEIELTGRPAGALPREVAGASPAYDLARYATRVRAITFLATP